jgi:hypothetical protein
MDPGHGARDHALQEGAVGTQFVVQLVNRPGALATFSRALAERGVSIGEISGGGGGAHAYAVVTTDDDGTTRAVLRSLGYPYVEGEAIVVEVADQPGGFAATTEKLAAAGVDIYGVLFLGRREGIVETAFTVDDVARARRALGLG